MYTQPHISRIHALSPLFSKMYAFRHSLEAIDFWKIQLPNEGTPRNIQERKTQDPHGMGVIDMWIDFCQAVDKNKFHEAIGNYFRLRRLLGV